MVKPLFGPLEGVLWKERPPLFHILSEGGGIFNVNMKKQ